MPVLTSLMIAASKPARWGFEIVDIRFGKACVRTSQDIAMRGDLLRSLRASRLYMFEGREGDMLRMTVWGGRAAGMDVAFLPVLRDHAT